MLNQSISPTAVLLTESNSLQSIEQTGGQESQPSVIKDETLGNRTIKKRKIKTINISKRFFLFILLIKLRIK
jgi:hypothetical protein